MALLRRAKALSRTTKPASNISAYEFYPWRLEVKTRCLVDTEGVQVVLTRQERDLLCIFLTNANRILTKNELLFRTRGRSYDPSDRSLYMLVSRLRRRLNTPLRQNPFIETEHSKGYVLVAEVRAIRE